MERNERLDRFSRDYRLAYSAKSEVQANIDRWIDLYERDVSETVRNGDSNIVVKDVKRAVEGLVPKLVETFVSTQDLVVSEPTAFGTAVGAKLNGAILNEEFDRLDKGAFVEDIARTLVIQGTVWIKSGWRGSRAYAYVCRNDAVFTDPSASSEDEMKFLCYRRRVSKMDIRSNEAWFGRGAYEKVKDAMASGVPEESGEMSAVAYERGNDSSFNFDEGDDRGLVNLIEYYGWDDNGNPLLFIWCEDNGEVLRDTESPFGDRPIPFHSQRFIRTPGSLWGEGLPSLIEDYQKVRTGIVNGIVDNMRMANNSQVFMRKGALDYVNYKRLRAGERYIQVNAMPSESMEHGAFHPITPSVFSVLEMFQIEEENVTGVTRFSQGSDPRALQSTARGIMSLSAMAEQRTTHAARLIAFLLEKVSESWMRLNKAFLPDVTGVTVDGTPGVLVRRDELPDAEAATVTVSAGTAGVKEKRIQDALLLLNVVKGSSLGGSQVEQELIASIAETSGFEPLARKIRAMDASSNPGAEAAAMEKSSELELNRAKAVKEMATARKAIADAESSSIRARADLVEALTPPAR